MGQDASSLSKLERAIGYYFRNRRLLTEAMAHDSLRANDASLPDYQRLEHLGDSVIAFVITNYLFRRYPNMNEGRLSIARADLVNQRKQAQISEDLELHKFVKMGQGVWEFKRYDKFLEALIGAIYVDAGGEETGYPVVKAVIYKLWDLEEQQTAGCVLM